MRSQRTMVSLNPHIFFVMPHANKDLLKQTIPGNYGILHPARNDVSDEI